MKLVVFDDGRPGVLTGSGVVDVSAITAKLGARAGNGQEAMEAIISNWDSVKSELESATAAGPAKPLSSVKLRSPLPRPGKIMAMGANYRENGTRPVAPMWGFLKSSEAVLDPGGTVVLPEIDANVFHHEPELVAVIGKAGHAISQANAMDHVFGYTCGIDVSARIFLYPNAGNLGKSYDTFAPMGPCIVTKDEIADPHNLQVRLTVDDELRGQYCTDDMAHPIPECIEWFSTCMTLKPGDVLFTGTNHQGLGAMQDGETIRMEIEKIGEITVHVSDPLKRRWAKGVDQSTAQSVRENSGPPGQNVRPLTQ